MKLRPLGDNVLIKRNEVSDASPGGIYIPEQARKREDRGVVVAVGRGRVTDSGKLVEPCVKSGDVVVFPRGLGSEVVIDGDALLVLPETEILGVIG
jgi:chaperonin GroES